MWKVNSSDSELEFESSQKKEPSNKKCFKKGKKADKERKEVKEKVPVKKEISLPDDGDDSSDEAETYGYGRLALGIDPLEIEQYDGKSVPVNGSQYLLSVLQEKKKTPKIVVAEYPGKDNKEGVNYLDKFHKEISFNSGVNVQEGNVVLKCLPSQEWRSSTLEDFSLLRSKIERWRELLSNGVTRLKTESIKLPSDGNKVVWMKFCFGSNFQEILNSRKNIEDDGADLDGILKIYSTDIRGQCKSVSSIIKNRSFQEQKGDHDDHTLSPSCITTTSDVVPVSSEGCSTSTQEGTNDGCQPLMSVMLILSQSNIESLFLFMSEWISQFGFINKSQGEWLYALLACIDKPVEPSTMGDIRKICKTLINIRNKFCEQLREIGIPIFEDIDKLSDDFKNELSLEEGTNAGATAEEYLSALNLLIYLIGDYFCQKDLICEM